MPRRQSERRHLPLWRACSRRTGSCGAFCGGFRARGGTKLAKSSIDFALLFSRSGLRAIVPLAFCPSTPSIPSSIHAAHVGPCCSRHRHAVGSVALCRVSVPAIPRWFSNRDGCTTARLAGPPFRSGFLASQPRLVGPRGLGVVTIQFRHRAVPLALGPTERCGLSRIRSGGTGTQETLRRRPPCWLECPDPIGPTQRSGSRSSR